jgi:3-oxoacyl-[acyl-carrier protein] reductase
MMPVLDQFRLDGRVAFVTGAGRGLGRAIAEAMAEAGAQVGVVDVDADVASDAAKEMVGRGLKAVGIGADVSDAAQVEAAVAAVTKAFGLSPNVLVNNAGVVRAAMIDKMTIEQWNEVLDVHCTGAFNCLRAVLDGMKSQGFGRMITMVSSAGLVGTIGQINYGTAKGGLVGFTFSAAKELARFNILANAIAPVANTRMTETVRNNEKWYNKYIEAIPLHRWAEPEEVAPAAVFLASPASSFITGHIVTVDGGQLMR